MAVVSGDAVQFKLPRLSAPVNGVVVSVDEPDRILIACSPEVGGVTALELNTYKFGVIWVPAAVVTKGQVPDLENFVIPKKVSLDAILGLCMAASDISDLSDTPAPAKTAASSSSQVPDVSAALAQVLAQLGSLSAAVESQQKQITSLSAQNVAAVPLPASPRPSLPASGKAAPLAPNLEKAKSSFWGSLGTDSEDTGEESSTDDDDWGGESFKLLEAPRKATKSAKPASGLEAFLKGSVSQEAPPTSAVPSETVSALANIEILRELRKGRKGRRRRHSTSSSSSGSIKGGGVRGIQRLRR